MNCNDFYVEMLERGIDNERRNLLRANSKLAEITFSGWIGVGKTTAVQAYCKKHSESLYFSFANTEYNLALKLFAKKYPTIFSDPKDWDEFFTQLHAHATKNLCTVFFDSHCNKSHPEIHAAIMNHFYENSHRAVFVFIEDDYGNRNFTPLHFGEIKKLFPKLTNEELVCIQAVTGGIASLVALYDPTLSFEINLKRFLQPDSYFRHLAERIIKEYFRTPESYNTLLYGISTGKRRVSELSAFSGYPNNKCDKYLKSLISHGIVKHVNAQGKQPAHYAITNGYLSFWYRYVFPQSDFRDEDVFQSMMQYVRSVLVKRAFRRECEYWLSNNVRAYRYMHGDFYAEKDRRYKNVRLEQVAFDLVSEDFGDFVYVKYFDTIGTHCTKADWDEIERVTANFSKNNTYILFSIHRFSDYCWKMSASHDNLRLVQSTAFLPCYDFKDHYRIEAD